jgi:hypothetical protein
MAEEEEEVEGEEGEEKVKDVAPEPVKPSEIQVNLGENAKYVATKFDVLFALTAKIQVTRLS